MRGPDSFSILDPKENEVMNIPILNEISSPSHINFDKYQTINIGLGGAYLIQNRVNEEYSRTIVVA